MKLFEEIAQRARKETPPDIDVRLLVRAAILTQPRQIFERDWMDLLVGLFSKSTVRVAVTLCILALLTAIPMTQSQATVQSSEVDHVAAFLLTGE